SKTDILRVGAALTAASPLAGPPHVRVTGFCRSLLNLGVRLTANEDSRACEIEPEQKRRHRIQSPLDPLGRTEMLLACPKQQCRGKPEANPYNCAGDTPLPPPIF